MPSPPRIVSRTDAWNMASAATALPRGLPFGSVLHFKKDTGDINDDVESEQGSARSTPCHLCRETCWPCRASSRPRAQTSGWCCPMSAGKTGCSPSVPTGQGRTGRGSKCPGGIRAPR